jgi:hypothetical protein
VSIVLFPKKSSGRTYEFFKKPFLLANLTCEYPKPVLLKPKQYGIGNARLYVITFEIDSFVTPWLWLWGQLNRDVTMSRSDGKASGL